MAEPPRKMPSAAEIAQRARELTPPVPKLGLGKLVVPPHKPTTPLGKAVQKAFGTPPPLPLAVKSSPEATIVTTVAPPAPLSAPQPPSRSLSPPPAELAPDPQSVREARQRAREKVAESERQAPPGPVLDSIKIELPANLRGGLGALGKAILGALAAALVGGGGAMVGSQSAIPPAVAECPAQLEQLRAKVSRLEGRTDRLEDDEDEGRKRWRKTDEKVEDTLGRVNDLEKRTPKVNP